MKKLPKEFFQNMTTQKNASKEKNDVVSFDFSKEVLDGKKKITVSLANAHK